MRTLLVIVLVVLVALVDQSMARRRRGGRGRGNGNGIVCATVDAAGNTATVDESVCTDVRLVCGTKVRSGENGEVVHCEEPDSSEEEEETICAEVVNGQEIPLATCDAANNEVCKDETNRIREGSNIRTVKFCDSDRSGERGRNSRIVCATVDAAGNTATVDESVCTDVGLVCGTKVRSGENGEVVHCERPDRSKKEEDTICAEIVNDQENTLATCGADEVCEDKRKRIREGTNIRTVKFCDSERSRERGKNSRTKCAAITGNTAAPITPVPCAQGEVCGTKVFGRPGGEQFSVCSNLDRVRTICLDNSDCPTGDECSTETKRMRDGVNVGDFRFCEEPDSPEDETTVGNDP